MERARNTAIALALCALASMPVARGASMRFLRDTALVYLSESDRKLQGETALHVLEDPEPNASREWKNSQSGHSGRAESMGKYKSEDGLQCRQLKLWTQARGIENQFAFPACKAQDGTWFIASGKKLSRVE